MAYAVSGHTHEIGNSIVGSSAEFVGNLSLWESGKASPKSGSTFHFPTGSAELSLQRRIKKKVKNAVAHPDRFLYWFASRKVNPNGRNSQDAIETILNHVQKFKSAVYGNILWLDPESRSALLVEVLARANSKPICSGCERPGPWYDTLPARMFEF
jgi:hypothetical protein